MRIRTELMKKVLATVKKRKEEEDARVSVQSGNISGAKVQIAEVVEQPRTGSLPERGSDLGGTDGLSDSGQDK